MNKKFYQKPATQVVAIKTQRLLTNASQVSNVNSGGVFNNSVSGGSGSARSRSFDDWDDED